MSGRLLRLLNPLHSMRAMSQSGHRRSLVDAAVEAVQARRPDAPADRDAWFGWQLPEQPAGRFAAVGYEGRGYVVDTVSGHVLWESEIADRTGLPRSMAEISR